MGIITETENKNNQKQIRSKINQQGNVQTFAKNTKASEEASKDYCTAHSRAAVGPTLEWVAFRSVPVFPAVIDAGHDAVRRLFQKYQQLE